MSIAELLGDSRPVLSDGAIGTMLQAAGLMPGTSPEIWNVEHEDRLRVIHTAYADAGAHLLTTNTFGGTRPRLALHGLEDRAHELNEAGARLAREVADASGVLAMGSMGPTGELMEPLGLYTHDQVVDLFAEQAAGLAAGGAQLLLAETFSDLGEVRAAVEGARRAAPRRAVGGDDDLRRQGPHDDGRQPVAGAARDRGDGRRADRRQLRLRPRGDRAGDDRDVGGAPGRRAADGAEQRRPAAAGRRRVPLRRHARGDGRATPCACGSWAST